jgi:3-dehydroquinate dehydratase II
MSKVLVCLNGPNLNLLGEREPHIYGHDTLDDVKNRLLVIVRVHGFELDFRQSNHEGELIDWIQGLRDKTHGLVINPGGLTHSSVSLHDALKSYLSPIYEVHISNPHAREPFRHHSFVSSLATGVIVGLGTKGYDIALMALIERLKT